MHFYTYDEWLSKDYYWIDAKELSIGETRSYQIASPNNRLVVRSTWQNSKFISTYDRGPTSINPVSSDIDCDLGCLYELKPTGNSLKGESGCLQVLGHPSGEGYDERPPYIRLGGDNAGYNSYSQRNWEELAINVTRSSSFERILIFQSIYSGAITYDAMNAQINFYLTDYSASEDQEPTCIVNTHLPGGTSLMIVGALITFDDNYVNITNISKFVHGHVDMDERYNWNLLWSTFVPPENSQLLPSSIMHRTKGTT